jgi:uncharacterized membrane protein YfcA
MQLSLLELVEAGVIGLGAGVLGGLAGVGGSMIMLPALHWVFGEKSPNTHHLYMAAAMTVNVFVAFPAAIRHHRNGAVRKDLLGSLIPMTMLSMVLGVLAGNMIDGQVLKVGLALFLLVYCAFNVWRLMSKSGIDVHGQRTTRTRLLVSAAMTGFIGGLLGLGGGVMMVPALQMLCRVPLKQAIATSSAVICITSIVGAGVKLASLPGLDQSVQDALLLAAVMAPTAMVGGVIGAQLTHVLPTRTVRLLVTLLLLVAAARLGGVFG